MKIFAIESSAKSASAALIDGGVLLGEFYIHTQLTHSETLMPMAEALLQNTRVPLEQVDVFAVSAGPGSFTGDGARLCFDRLQGRLEARLAPELLRYQKASNVAFAALRKAENGLLLTASELMPVYLRLPQATRELNKRKGASQQ